MIESLLWWWLRLIILSILFFVVLGMFEYVLGSLFTCFHDEKVTFSDPLRSTFMCFHEEKLTFVDPHLLRLSNRWEDKNKLRHT